MKSLSFYEFTGIVLPGTIILLGLSLLFPSTKTILLNDSLSVGDFGLVLILAYAAGQIIQAVGNLLENVWWKFQGGMPTDWVRQQKGHILSDAQIDKLQKCIHAKLEHPKIDLDKITASDWFNITRQINSHLLSNNKTERIDIFNGNYGLNRGIAAALLTLAVLVPFSESHDVSLVMILLAVSFIAIYRMNRFAKHYARELFLQFISL